MNNTEVLYPHLSALIHVSKYSSLHKLLEADFLGQEYAQCSIRKAVTDDTTLARRSMLL